MKSPIDLLMSLLTDVKRLEPDVGGLDRDVITVKKRFEHEGHGFLTVTLPTLGNALRRGLAEGKFTCPPGFKMTRGGAIPRLFSGMLCKVFDTVTGELVHQPCVRAIKLLQQVLMMFKKLLLHSGRIDLLDRKAKREFFECDKQCLSSIPFDDRELFVLDRVTRYILPNIESFDEGEIICRHGPGAVYEKLSANQKWEALLTYSSKLEEMGFDVLYAREGDEDGEILASMTSQYGVSGDVARLVSVEKNSTSRRTITVEPVVRQFVQQGYNTLLRREIDKCSVLNRCLALSDQGKNQQLALEGSQTTEWSTLDLKSASDLLSLRIVELIFRHKPRFLAGILGCRSTYVDTDEGPYLLKKFAGMGNATTFPVQSVVFATLAIAAIVEERRPSYVNVQRVASLVRVYGDDIIVPTRYVRQVVSWITKAGLLVNLGKSFTTGNFRESCGVDAFMGVDVTPIYVKRCPENISKKEPSTLAHLVSASNHSWIECLYGLSTTIKEAVESALRRELPLVPSTSSLLGWHTRRNYAEIHRWSRTLHRFETSGPVLVSLKKRDKIDGYAALLKFYHAPEPQYVGSVPIRSIDPNHLKHTPIRFSLRVVSRWVPSL